MKLLSSSEFKALHRSTLRKFSRFIKEKFISQPEWVYSFVKWLGTYINYQITKESFRATT